MFFYMLLHELGFTDIAKKKEFIDRLRIFINWRETWLDVSNKLGAGLVDIVTWMSKSRLKLNQQKMELIILNPKHMNRMITLDIQLKS